MKRVILIGLLMCLYVSGFKSEHKAVRKPLSRSYVLSFKSSITNTIKIRLTSYDELGIEIPEPTKYGYH